MTLGSGRSWANLPNSAISAGMGLRAHETDIEAVSFSDLPNTTELVVEWGLSPLAPGPGPQKNQELWSHDDGEMIFFSQINVNMHSIKHIKYKVHV